MASEIASSKRRGYRVRDKRPDERGLYQCGGCEQYKPRNEFWTDKSRIDGYQSQCKDCSRKRNREVSYPRMRTVERYKEQHRIRSKRTTARYPERAKARGLVRGLGLKKSACEHCGATQKLQLHHPDYSKPLEVVTLCIPCHRIADKEVRSHGQA